MKRLGSRDILQIIQFQPPCCCHECHPLDRIVPSNLALNISYAFIFCAFVCIIELMLGSSEWEANYALKEKKERLRETSLL